MKLNILVALHPYLPGTASIHEPNCATCKDDACGDADLPCFAGEIRTVLCASQTERTYKQSS